MASRGYNLLSILVVSMGIKRYALNVKQIIKEVTNMLSTLLSFTSTREFLKTRGKSGEAQAKGKCLSHFSSVPKNSQVLKSTTIEEQVFLFFL